MKIGLVDVDGHNFPNYALMKLSAYHKSQGDSVEWADPLFGRYDRVYMSKIFTFTPHNTDVWDCEVVKGGTGYDIASKLPDEVDRLQPDYSIYPNIDTKTSYGFLTRGCPNKCSWCIVPSKEGKTTPYMTVDEITQNGKRPNVILMDNNVLSSDYGLEQIEIASKRGYRLDFNQGLDARLITDDIAKLLASCKWLKYIRFACDQSAQIPQIERALTLLRKYGYNKPLFCYCLINNYAETYNRMRYLWQNRKDIHPHCQPYRDFNNPNQIIPQWQKDMAHWANKMNIYQSIWFDDFMPRKGFKCSEYAKMLH